MHQQDLYGFVKHSQLRERKTDPKSQIIISRSFVLTFVDIGFLKQIGNNEVQINNILEVESYLFRGSCWVCLSSHLSALHSQNGRLWELRLCLVQESLCLFSSGLPHWTKHNSKHGSFGDAAAVTVKSYQMHSKWNRNCNTCPCLQANSCHWKKNCAGSLLDSVGYSHLNLLRTGSKDLAACLQLLHSSPKTRDLARHTQNTP
jgi:hypothetical protein